MGALVMDITLFAVTIVVLSAFLAVIVQKIGVTIFGRGKQDEFIGKSKFYQSNWNGVGGKAK